jgi:signal transduction histidine kinase
MFARSFLDTETHFPRMANVLYWCAVITGTTGVATFLAVGPYYISTVAYPATLPFPFILTYVGIISLRKGVRQARFYVAAWLAFLVGMPLYLLKDLALVQDSSISTYAVQIGTLLEALLLSFALADRMKIMRDEKDRAETLALEVLQKSKDELEKKVSERTKELRVAKDNAENANLLKDKFVSIASHDLKVPIGAIRELLNASLDPTLSPEEVRNNAKSCHDGTKGLLEMIDKLLDVSRLQTGSIHPEKEGFDLLPVTLEVLNKVSPLADAKGIRIINVIDWRDYLYADKVLAGVVMQNLLTNAIKFTPKGGIVTIYVPAPNTVAIKDTGVGIPMSMKPYLFRHDVKTVRLGTAGETGTGLGLPFCHDIMKAHGGVLTVETGETGAIFYAKFPHQNLG